MGSVDIEAVEPQLRFSSFLINIYCSMNIFQAIQIAKMVLKYYYLVRSFELYRTIKVPEILQKNDELYRTLRDNRYPETLIKKNLSSLPTNTAIHTAEKKPVFLKLPFKGNAVT